MLIVLLPLILTVICVLAAGRMLRHGAPGAPRRHSAPVDRHPDHYPFALTLQVSGMTGSHSERRIREALNQLEGIWADAASAEEGTVHVLCKERPDLAAVKQGVASAGCTVLHIEKES